MDDRVIGGSQCREEQCDHKSHADLWNIPTGMYPLSSHACAIADI
jgi:hypothetical protein